MIDMNILNKLRNVGFWFIDSVNGGIVKNAFHELELVDGTASTDDEFLTHKNNLIKKYWSMQLLQQISIENIVIKFL